MITIELLKDHMNHVPRLAAIWHEVLGSVWIPSITTTEVENWMYAWKNSTSLPVAHVALDGDRPVGVCSLQQNDGIRPDLWPWLCDLAVALPYQKQGIGRRLIEATTSKARELGYQKLYLFAFDPTLPTYYGRLGWRVIGEDRHRGLPVTVMTTDLGQ